MTSLSGEAVSETAVSVSDLFEYKILACFDDASDLSPTWVDLTASLRSFNVQRGRTDERQQMDAGTASFTLSNRDGALDPLNSGSPYYPNIRPMNRWWLRAQYAGVTFDLFKGWADAYPQDWPAVGKDAIVTVSAVDEFTVLSLAKVPAMDPPKDTYGDLVQFDQATAYWKLNDGTGLLFSSDSSFKLSAVLGPELALANGTDVTAVRTDGAIRGEDPDPHRCLRLGLSTSYASAQDLEPLSGGDIGSANEWAVEMWFKAADIAPASDDFLFRGPTTPTANEQYYFGLTTAGSITFNAIDQSGVDHTVDSPVLADNLWYHLVATVVGGTLTLYVNGTAVDTASFAGTTPDDITVAFDGTSDGIILGDPTAPADFRYFDEIAVYRSGLSAARVQAHYTAGTARGFPWDQPTHERLVDILDSVSNHAPRSIRTGSRNMTGSFMHRQAPIDEVRDAVQAEAPNGALFMAGDGSLVSLDNGHRSSSPWNTTQMTFNDNGSNHAYHDISVDYSDTYLANVWDVTAVGGLTQTATDATSVAAYYERVQSLPELKITNGDAEALNVAGVMLAKYKDPLVRITGLEPKMSDTATASGVLALELMDRIRVLRHPLGGGTIDQTSYVQHIDISGEPSRPWPTVKLGVSPV